MAVGALSGEDPGMNEAMEQAKRALESAPAGVPGWLMMLHVLGVVVYAGGVLLQARLLALVAAAAADVRASMAALARRVYLWILLPFGALMLATGVYLLVSDPGGEGYMKQGAFHMKITLVLVLMIVEHVMVLRPLKGLSRGVEPQQGLAMYRAAFPLVLLLVFAILLALFVLRAG